MTAKERSIARAERIAVRAGVMTPGARALPEETPVALSFGGTTQAVMMATPQDLEDFGVGFSLSEAIVGTPAGHRTLDAVESDQGIDLQMRVADDLQAGETARRRKMAGPVGCGLCGIESSRRR
jgi:FdhD protein